MPLLTRTIPLCVQLSQHVIMFQTASSSKKQPIAMHLSLEGHLHSSEVFSEAILQFQHLYKPEKTTKQVLLWKFTTLIQTTKDGIALPCYCRAVKEQVFQVSSCSPLTQPYSTKQIIPENATSVKTLPQLGSSIMMEEQMTVRRRGLVKKHVGVDYEVWKWKENLEQSRRGAKRVTKKEVKEFALEAYKMAGVNNFKIQM
ncbi:hypothetical protein J6590_052278 [Homalodisca vitripennis]|nr:hypothetical protein J6590_052278 [Homalodisca vitripennis]